MVRGSRDSLNYLFYAVNRKQSWKYPYISPVLQENILFLGFVSGD